MAVIPLTVPSNPINNLKNEGEHDMRLLQAKIGKVNKKKPELSYPYSLKENPDQRVLPTQSL